MDTRMREVLQRARRVLDREDYQTLEAIFESYAYIAELVSQEDMTTDRLYEMLYGPGEQPSEAVACEGRNPDTAPNADRRVGIVGA